MKEYRLKSWPELPAAFRRTVYRRLLSDLSQRHMSVAALRQRSGLSTSDVRSLMHYLETEGLLDEREVQEVPQAGLMARFAWPLPAWMRRSG
jgi:predicted DNA-binding ArsR family transcriptional regulator